MLPAEPLLDRWLAALLDGAARAAVLLLRGHRGPPPLLRANQNKILTRERRTVGLKRLKRTSASASVRVELKSHRCLVAASVRAVCTQWNSVTDYLLTYR